MLYVTPSRALIASAFLVSIALTACLCSEGRMRTERAGLFAGRSTDEWCALLEPEAEARAWQSIPWRTSFHAGLAAAAESKRPLLLWLMNGHPLGCT